MSGLLLHFQALHSQTLNPQHEENHLMINDMPLTDLVLRLVTAVLVGGLLGLNRDLHKKRAGLRTHALVTLGAAMATIAMLGDDFANLDAVSRVLQGILTGIGFLGAGVIIRDAEGHVSGLTTAATIWVSAVLGTLCGLGHWLLIGISSLLIVGILTVGGRLEKIAERVFGRNVDAQNENMES
jgi:putative Mg2+ transporter-C (MgtC) family protein